MNDVPSTAKEQQPPAPQEATPEAASETTAQSTPEHKMRSLFEGFKQRADQFVREHFKGEYVEKPAEINKVEISKALGTGLLGVAASVGGIKSFADVPRWMLQKYYTQQEQERIKDAIDLPSPTESIDGEMDVGDKVFYVNAESTLEHGWTIVEKSEDGNNAIIKKGDEEHSESMSVNLNELLPAEPISLIEQKKQRLEQAINASKYLSPEKKQELLGKLNDTVKTYETQMEEWEGERNEKIGKLLDEAIQTRVKGTTALKETLNTALIATGLVTLRGVGYGAVALFERYRKVIKEMESGEREKGLLAKEVIVNGFTETWDKLWFKSEKTKTKRQEWMDFAQALGTVGRFVGFAGLAMDEITDSGGISEALDKMQEAFEKKGALEAASENFGAKFDQVMKFATLGMAGGEEGAADATEASEAKKVMEEREAEEEQEGTEATEAAPIPEPAAEPAPETREEEVLEERKVLEVQEASEAQGTKAPEAAPAVPETLSPDEMQAGTVRKGDGIIRLVQRQLKLNPEKYGYTGDPEDKQAVAKWVRKAALTATKNAGFVKEDGWLGVSGKAIDKMALGVHNEGGELKLDFYDAKTGEQMSLENLQENKLVYDYQKYEEFDAEEAGGSSEAQAVETPKAEDVTTESPKLTDTEEIVGVPEPTPGVAVTQEPTPGVAATPIETFQYKDVSVKFSHDAGGKVTGIILVGNREPTTDDLERAAGHFGTERSEIYHKYIRLGDPKKMFKANAPAEALLGKMYQEHQIQRAINALENQENTGTPEYQYLKQQAGKLKGTIKTAFEKLGLTKQVEALERATQNVTEVATTDAEKATVIPDVIAASEVSGATDVSGAETAGGLKFADGYPIEEQEKITAYLTTERLTNEALAKQLTEYQTTYGDRPKFHEFKRAVLARMNQRQNHIDQVVKQIADSSAERPEVNITGNLSPAEAAKISAKSEIDMEDQKVILLNTTERAANATDEIDAALAEDSTDSADATEAASRNDVVYLKPGETPKSQSK